MTTAERIIESIRINGVATKSGHIRRSTVAEYTARACASSILTPMVPAGTLQWLAHPHAGESVAAYAERAVAVAAARSTWAGGLLDGTDAYPDAAAVQSVAAIVR